MKLNTIELSREHYRMLLKLVYLGRTMYIMNEDDVCKDSDTIEQLIYSFTKDFDSEDIVSFKKLIGQYTPSEDFEKEMEMRIDLYEDEIFRLELSRRLADRDFAKSYSPEHIAKMDKKEILNHKYKLTFGYIFEYEKFGIDRLHISRETP